MFSCFPFLSPRFSIKISLAGQCIGRYSLSIGWFPAQSCYVPAQGSYFMEVTPAPQLIYTAFPLCAASHLLKQLLPQQGMKALGAEVPRPHAWAASCGFVWLALLGAAQKRCPCLFHKGTNAAEPGAVSQSQAKSLGAVSTQPLAHGFLGRRGTGSVPGKPEPWPLVLC